MDLILLMGCVLYVSYAAIQTIVLTSTLLKNSNTGLDFGLLMIGAPVITLVLVWFIVSDLIIAAIKRM